MELPDDIRRVAESASGQRFRASNSARLNGRVRSARDRRDARAEAEYARHLARMKAIEAGCEAAIWAAREAHHDAEREFFRKRLEPLPPPPDTRDDKIEPGMNT